jgi:hypothetical protein
MVFIFVDIDVLSWRVPVIPFMILFLEFLLYDDLFSLKMTVVTLVHFLLYDLQLNTSLGIYRKKSKL